MPGESALGAVLLMSDMIITRAITTATPATEIIEILGNHTLLFTDGVEFRITGSTGNDGHWICDGDSTFNGTHTLILVTGDITDATADGIVELWREVAHITNIGGPGFTLDMVEVTSHDSPGQAEEFVPGIVRTGEVPLEINYDPTEVTHDATNGLPHLLINQELTDFEIVWPIPVIGGTTWEISAFVVGFEPSAPFDGKVSASVALKVTGVPVIV